MFMEVLSVSHSSLISLRTVEASLRSDASLGNSVATRVRRFISLLMRSVHLWCGVCGGGCPAPLKWHQIQSDNLVVLTLGS